MDKSNSMYIGKVQHNVHQTGPNIFCYWKIAQQVYEFQDPYIVQLRMLHMPLNWDAYGMYSS